MEVNELILALKTDFPKKAIDVSESLDLLREAINDTMNTINERVNEAFINRDFAAREKYNRLISAVYEYEQMLDGMISRLDIGIGEIQTEEDVVEKERRGLPNYSDYYVDTNVEHTLYEDFTHKRPCGFRVNSEKVVEVNTWKDMLVRLCEILIVIDEKTFMKFESVDRMNGKKRKYFSTNKSEMFEPLPIHNKIFVETHMSSNGFRNLIIKLLKEYNFKINEFKVYLRADYSELNK